MRVSAVLFLCASASALEMTAHSMTAGKMCHNNLGTNGAGNGKYGLGDYADQAACESACVDAAIIAGFTATCCQFNAPGTGLYSEKCYMSENAIIASGNPAVHFASIVDNLHSMTVGNKCSNNLGTNAGGSGTGKQSLGVQVDHAACESACEVAAGAAGFTAGCCQFKTSDNKCWWSENSIVASASTSVVHFASVVDNFHSMTAGNRCNNNLGTNAGGDGKQSLGVQVDHAACELACEVAAGAAGLTEGCCQFKTGDDSCYWSENAIIATLPATGDNVVYFASIVDAPSSVADEEGGACSAMCCKGTWSGTVCTPAADGLILVQHDTTSGHSHHRCYQDSSHARLCRCQCANSADAWS